MSGGEYVLSSHPQVLLNFKYFVFYLVHFSSSLFVCFCLESSQARVSTPRSSGGEPLGVGMGKEVERSGSSGMHGPGLWGELPVKMKEGTRTGSGPELYTAAFGPDCRSFVSPVRCHWFSTGQFYSPGDIYLKILLVVTELRGFVTGIY